MTCYCDQNDVDASVPHSQVPWSDTDNVLVVFGSRSLSDSLTDDGMVRLVRNTIDDAGERPDYVLSGGADGADWAAELAANELGLGLVVFDVDEPARWKRQRRRAFDVEVSSAVVTRWGGGLRGVSGVGAYHLRNCLMAEAADRGLGFWDGESSGTENMLEFCEDHGTPTEVVAFSG